MAAPRQSQKPERLNWQLAAARTAGRNFREVKGMAWHV
jgi:hypothetical protein